MTDAVPEAWVGEVLDGKYRIEAVIGAGSNGCVYRARHLILDRLVAIKALHARHATNATQVSRLVREARALSAIRHPNVVDVIDVLDGAGGPPLIVQELLEGEELLALMRRNPRGLPLAQAMPVFLPIAEAVAAAHAKGVVHRDLKPANVILAKVEGRIVPKVVDFGIAKQAGRRPVSAETQEGTVLGTPAYMAPEQIQEPDTVGPATDVWALGVILYEMLAGVRPFEGQTANDVMVKVCREAPVAIEQRVSFLPRGVAQIIDRCLKRYADQRYPSARELADELAACWTERRGAAAVQTSTPTLAEKRKADLDALLKPALPRVVPLADGSGGSAFGGGGAAGSGGGSGGVRELELPPDADDGVRLTLDEVPAVRGRGPVGAGLHAASADQAPALVPGGRPRPASQSSMARPGGPAAVGRNAGPQALARPGSSAALARPGQVGGSRAESHAQSLAEGALSPLVAIALLVWAAVASWGLARGGPEAIRALAGDLSDLVYLAAALGLAIVGFSAVGAYGRVRWSLLTAIVAACNLMLLAFLVELGLARWMAGSAWLVTLGGLRERATGWVTGALALALAVAAVTRASGAARAGEPGRAFSWGATVLVALGALAFIAAR